MNALLQHRGHVLMGAGHSIAVQNFNENIGILVMVGLYALMVLARASSINAAIVLFGLFVAGAMVLVMLAPPREPGAAGDSLHLIARSTRAAQRARHAATADAPRRALQDDRPVRQARCVPRAVAREMLGEQRVDLRDARLDAVGEAPVAKRRLHRRGRSPPTRRRRPCAWMPRSATISTSRSASSR